MSVIFPSSAGDLLSPDMSRWLSSVLFFTSEVVVFFPLQCKESSALLC